jgi:DNA-binding transcriptional MerR regulator
MVPSHRSPAGHRLYTAADISRLQEIVALSRALPRAARAK